MFRVMARVTVRVRDVVGGGAPHAPCARHALLPGVGGRLGARWCISGGGYVWGEEVSMHGKA